jgi:hypothetical protein
MDKIFKENIPMLLRENILKKGGKLILPNLDYVQESLNILKKEIGDCYSWHFITSPEENPLYKATNTCSEALMTCPDMLTNETQLNHY